MFFTLHDGQISYFPTFAEAADYAVVHANTHKVVMVGRDILLAFFWCLKGFDTVWFDAVSGEGTPLLEEWALSLPINH